jgi:hypothetical protein
VVEAIKAAFKIDGGIPRSARQALAKHIVNMAKQGERDRQRLIEGAWRNFKGLPTPLP